jgi:nucleotide-binding universal stress UspA family protein
MYRKILLGVDAELSPATQRALLTACELSLQALPHYSLLLLTVVPATQASTVHPGIYIGQLLPITAPTWQKSQAEEVLHKANLLLEQHGIAKEYIEDCVRVGIVAEEIARVAQDQNVSMIVLGSRGESWRQKLRRFFIGSISRRVLQLAPCPVVIVVPPRDRPQSSDLVSWYENAITRYLNEHQGSLSVFIPGNVAEQFAPPDKTVGELEIRAATQALEKLAYSGTLFRHQIANEVRYVND